MIYKNLTITDSYYLLEADDNKLYIPISKAILVDDESGLISFKSVASRKILAQVRKSN